MINLSQKITDNFKSKVKGQIVLPSDSSYDEVRQIWNAMIERRPALIVRCAGTFFFSNCFRPASGGIPRNGYSTGADELSAFPS